jgi:hypothetical protein
VLADQQAQAAAVQATHQANVRPLLDRREHGEGGVLLTTKRAGRQRPHGVKGGGLGVQLDIEPLGREEPLVVGGVERGKARNATYRAEHHLGSRLDHRKGPAARQDRSGGRHPAQGQHASANTDTPQDLATREGWSTSRLHLYGLITGIMCVHGPLLLPR